MGKPAGERSTKKGVRLGPGTKEKRLPPPILCELKKAARHSGSVGAKFQASLHSTAVHQMGAGYQ